MKSPLSLIAFLPLFGSVALLGSLSLLGSATLLADRMTPAPYVVAAGHLYAKSFPAQEAKRWGGDEAAGETLVYQMGETEGDADQLLHRFNWYARKIYLTSYDGVCVVRMGAPWYGHQPSAKDLEIAFYRDGELLARYSPFDLAGKGDSWREWEETSRLKFMASGYLVLQQVIGFVFIDKKMGDSTVSAVPERGFEVVLYDGTHIVFDLGTGKPLVLADNEFTRSDPR